MQTITNSSSNPGAHIKMLGLFLLSWYKGQQDDSDEIETTRNSIAIIGEYCPKVLYLVFKTPASSGVWEELLNQVNAGHLNVFAGFHSLVNNALCCTRTLRLLSRTI